jgi:hypothetical protein
MPRRASPSPSERRRRRRAAGRQRWRRWSARRRAGRAVIAVEYGGAELARLIMAGWLERRPDDLYRPQQIASAIADLLERGVLPRKIT